MGPLMCAMVVWRNSLVFHSLDKLTSFFLHSFPPITVHLLRWGLIPSEHDYSSTSLSLAEVYSLSLGLYITWQLGYWALTEILLRTRLAADKKLMTSLRYFVTGKHQGIWKICLFVLLTLRLKTPEEVVEMDSMKAKVVLAIVQLAFTMGTVLPTYFLYCSYSLSCVYIMIILTWGAWNGASYYIEVFAERYTLKFVTEEAESEENMNL